MKRIDLIGYWKLYIKYKPQLNFYLVADPEHSVYEIKIFGIGLKLIELPF